MKLIASPALPPSWPTNPHRSVSAKPLECFATRDRSFLVDDREEHHTDPPTLWFISDTFMGRLLKVVFVQTQDGAVILKTAYDPNAEERWVYQTHAREL